MKSVEPSLCTIWLHPEERCCAVLMAHDASGRPRSQNTRRATPAAIDFLAQVSPANSLAKLGSNQIIRVWLRETCRESQSRNMFHRQSRRCASRPGGNGAVVQAKAATCQLNCNATNVCTAGKWLKPNTATGGGGWSTKESLGLSQKTFHASDWTPVCGLRLSQKNPDVFFAAV